MEGRTTKIVNFCKEIEEMGYDVDRILRLSEQDFKKYFKENKQNIEEIIVFKKK